MNFIVGYEKKFNGEGDDILEKTCSKEMRNITCKNWNKNKFLLNFQLIIYYYLVKVPLYMGIVDIIFSLSLSTFIFLFLSYLLIPSFYSLCTLNLFAFTSCYHCCLEANIAFSFSYVFPLKLVEAKEWFSGNC